MLLFAGKGTLPRRRHSAAPRPVRTSAAPGDQHIARTEGASAPSKDSAITWATSVWPQGGSPRESTLIMRKCLCERTKRKKHATGQHNAHTTILCNNVAPSPATRAHAYAHTQAHTSTLTCNCISTHLLASRSRPAHSISVRTSAAPKTGHGWMCTSARRADTGVHDLPA